MQQQEQQQVASQAAWTASGELGDASRHRLAVSRGVWLTSSVAPGTSLPERRHTLSLLRVTQTALPCPSLPLHSFLLSYFPLSSFLSLLSSFVPGLPSLSLPFLACVFFHLFCFPSLTVLIPSFSLLSCHFLSCSFSSFPIMLSSFHPLSYYVFSPPFLIYICFIYMLPISSLFSPLHLLSTDVL